MTPSVTQAEAFTALRAFLLSILPSGTEVIQGQQNRVPTPASANFAVMAITSREKMARPAREYLPDAGQEEIDASTALHFQIDVYGPAAGDIAQAITTIMGDASGVEAFAGTGVAPLYCKDPQQLPVVFGEQQYTQRWMIGCALHGNITVTRDIDFAEHIITTLSEYK